MNGLIEVWYLVVAALCVLLVWGGVYVAFFKAPSEVQIRKIKAWLLFAVTEAEVELGSGTGQLKLRYVYDLFITRFTWISRLISFDMFSDLVDEALDEMRAMLASNSAAKALVYPE